MRTLDSAPVVVYTMGKVGTDTVLKGLENAGVEVYKTHHLVDEVLRQRIDQLVQSGNPITRTLSTSIKVVEEIVPGNDHVKIVTLVRESIGRNMSGFFQALHRRGYVEPYDRYDPSDLVRVFHEDSEHERPDNWFEEDFIPALDCDPFALEFAADTGWSRYSAGKFSVLLMQTELGDVRQQAALSDFVGREIELKRANVGNRKQYGDLYKQFKARVEFSEEFLQRTMASKVMSHFYTRRQREHVAGFYRREIQSLHPFPRAPLN